MRSSKGASKAQKTGASSSASKGKQPTTTHPTESAPPNRREQFRRLEKLQKRTIRSTRFFDEPTCDQLGITPYIVRMARNINWNNWITLRMPDANGNMRVPHTYRDLTLEFLSSFHFRLTQVRPSDTRTRSRVISFKLFKTHHELTLRQLNEYFGWSNDNNVTVISEHNWRDYDELAWWGRITDSKTPFASRMSKASEIQHVALRYFHRMLVHCLFSRTEIGQVHPDELRLLWLATEGHNYQDLLYDYAFFLAYRFAEIAEGHGNTGTIYIGGMITWIAFKLGYGDQINRLQPIEENPVIDLPVLRTSYFIRTYTKGRRDYLVWLVRETSWCYLPNDFISTFYLDHPEGVNPWRVQPDPIPLAERSDAEKRTFQLVNFIQQASSAPQQPIPPPQPQAPPTAIDMSPLMNRLNEMHDYNVYRFNQLGYRLDRVEDSIRGLRADVDHLQRVNWREHVSNVDSGRVRAFPNHPNWPPEFDPSVDPTFHPLYHFCSQCPPYGGPPPQQ